MEKNIKTQIAENISKIAEKEGFLPIEILIRGSDKLPVIEVFVDSSNNVSAEDCAALSRIIEEYLATEQDLSTTYRLDVSSPGIERPLKFLAQYPKHINRKLEIEFSESDTVKKLTAKLIAVNNDTLTFESDKKNTIDINFNNIKKAVVTVSFS